MSGAERSHSDQSEGNSTMRHRQRIIGSSKRRGTPRGVRWSRRAGRKPLHTSREQARRLNEEELKRLTKDELDTLARDEQLPLRSKMNKAQLARTLRRHFRQASR